jgi:predicted nucleotidyltransferase
MAARRWAAGGEASPARGERVQAKLEQLVRQVEGAAGERLKSVVLYGSAAAGDYHPKHSDLNVLCVFDRLGPEVLDRLSPVVAWWERKGHRAPLVFTLEELRRGADTFAIELIDIQASRRVLWGEDVFAALEVPLGLHRLEVERELRASLVRLRQRYLAGSHEPQALFALMTASVSTFASLFRHALLVLGEPRPGSKREAVERLAARLGIDPAPFCALLDLREGSRSEQDLDAREIFRGYLGAVERVVEEVDRQFAG